MTDVRRVYAYLGQRLEDANLQGDVSGLQDGTKDNPAVHVKRKGNDVVKRASELAVLDPQVSC